MGGGSRKVRPRDRCKVRVRARAASFAPQWHGHWVGAWAKTDKGLDAGAERLLWGTHCRGEQEPEQRALEPRQDLCLCRRSSTVSSGLNPSEFSMEERC